MVLVPWLCAVILAPALLAQQPPARDRAGAATPAAPRGTGSIAGVVMTTGETPQPIRNVTVLVSRSQLALPQAVVSDEQGRFQIDGLAAGNYLVTSQKPAWVAANRSMRSLAGQPGGVPVVVNDGEAVTGVTLRMHKGGVLAGTVRLPSGRPAAGVSVMGLGVVMVNGARVTSMVASPVTTDDLGAYRIYGLPAGQYVVQVRETAFMASTTDMRQTLASDVRWAEALQAQGALPAPDPGPTVQRASTYYPGTQVLADAAIIQVSAGEERAGLDFEVGMVPTTTVTGTVLRPDGNPAIGAPIVLQPPASTGQEELVSQVLGAGRGNAGAGGAFTVSGVAPGRYDVVVRVMSDGRPIAGNMGLSTMMGMSLPTGRGAVLWWARESIEVNGQPVGPLSLRLQEGLSVSGSLVFEGGTPPAATSVRVGVGSQTALGGLPDVAMFASNLSTSTAAADGTFNVTGLMPGEYRLTVMMPGMRMMATEPGRGWMVKSVRVGDRELADEGLDLRNGLSLSGVVVTLTDQPSELTGRVLDAGSRAVADYPVVVFSTDRAHWRAGGRRVQSVQPASDGSFVIAGLPAGSYYLAVVSELDTRELASRDLLESLVPAAITVTLADGERKSQDVRVR